MSRRRQVTGELLRDWSLTGGLISEWSFITAVSQHFKAYILYNFVIG